MISVDQAVQRIVGAFHPLGTERVSVANSLGRVLAEDTKASFDQPPAPVSAMDGYAVRTSDAVPGAELTVIGHSPAGNPYAGKVGAKQAVRIFTGGVVPEGADSVVIQEDVEARGDRITVKEAPPLGENVRARGLDFHAGDILLTKGHRIGPRDVALLAAADLAQVMVTRKPRIAIAATGDELSRPGEARKPGGIVASSTYAIQAMVARWGGEPVDIGIFADNPEAYAELPKYATGCDLVVTLGGASVGDHDLIQSALAPHGFTLDFWKIAMRPGKPLIFGQLRQAPLLGLPGNPVSAMVCSILFLAPAMAAMQGARYEAPIVTARSAEALRANGRRQDYIRSRLKRENGVLTAEPFAQQDSSMQNVFAQADGLIVRPVHAPPVAAGGEVPVFLLDGC